MMSDETINFVNVGRGKIDLRGKGPMLKGGITDVYMKADGRLDDTETFCFLLNTKSSFKVYTEISLKTLKDILGAFGYEARKKDGLSIQAAKSILIDEIKRAKLYRKLWQSFCVLLPVKTVGVMGDKRTYDNVAAIRAVTSKDAMTAQWAKLPYRLLERVSSRIINEVKGINRVVYDISSKPPSTIEWE